MKIFVTGATGFIGSHFLNSALSAGHEVVALRRSENSKPRVPIIDFKSSTVESESINEQQATNTYQPTAPAARLHWLTKEMADVTADDFSGCDVLVHLAAAGVMSSSGWKESFEVNVTQSLNLWLLAAETGISQYVICGSCFEYGKSGERYDFIPTNAPLEPTGPYHASKAAATMAAIALAHNKNLRMAILRPFHVYGEGEPDSRVWQSLRNAAMSGHDLEMTPAEQIRDFIAVKEVATLLLEACSAQVKPGLPQIINLGTGKPQTLRAFAEFWWEKWNGKGKLLFGAKPYRDGEVMRYVPLVEDLI